MNYKILIPCLLVGVLSMVGIFLYLGKESIVSEDIIEPFVEEEFIASEDIVESLVDKVPERKIIVDVSKKIEEECDSDIIKCDTKNGCVRQC